MDPRINWTHRSLASSQIAVSILPSGPQFQLRPSHQTRMPPLGTSVHLLVADSPLVAHRLCAHDQLECGLSINTLSIVCTILERVHEFRMRRVRVSINERLSYDIYEILTTIELK